METVILDSVNARKIFVENANDYRAAREAMGWTLEEASRRSGYSISTINGLENRGEGSTRLREALDRIYGLHKSEAEVDTKTITDFVSRPLHWGEKHVPGQPRSVPVLSWAQAGRLTGNITWEDLPDDHHEHLLSDCPDPHAIAVRVRGDSMIPEFREGDIVVLMPSRQPRNGSLVVARFRDTDEVLFKRFHVVDPADHRLQLTSYNPVYPPIEITEEQLAWCYPVHSSVRHHW